MAEETKQKNENVNTKDTKKAEAKSDAKLEAKIETKQETEKVISKKKEEKVVKDKAIANGFSLRISPKQSKYVCRMIKGKTPERAIEMLKDVAKGKLAVKMTGLEVPHQKGKGIAGAKFPKNAAEGIMEIVKQLAANSITNGIEDPVITIAMPNKAPAPFKRGGRRGKRTHLHLESMSRIKLIKKKK